MAQVQTSPLSPSGPACGTSQWNSDLAAARDRTPFDDVTMHDYQLNDAEVNSQPTWARLSVIAAFAEAAALNAAEVVVSCFGRGTRLWMTEFNYGGKATFLPDLYDGAIHGMYLVGRWIAAVNRNDVFEAVNFHAALSANGVAWDSAVGVVRVQVDWTAKPVPRIQAANVTGTGQVLAHVASLARGASRMAGLQVLSGPSLTFAVAGRADLPCITGAAFLDSSSLVLINRCNDATTAVIAFPAPLGSRANVTFYAGSDPGGAAPLPDPSEPLPWRSGPLAPLTNLTATVGPAANGSVPVTVTLPDLGLAIISFS